MPAGGGWCSPSRAVFVCSLVLLLYYLAPHRRSDQHLPTRHHLPAAGMYINTTVACVVPTKQPRIAHMRHFFASESLSRARFTYEIGAFVDYNDPIVNVMRVGKWKLLTPFHERLARDGPVQSQLVYVAHYLTYTRALEWYLRQNPAEDACLLMLEDDVGRSGQDDRNLSEIVRAAPDFAALFLQWCYGQPWNGVEVAPGMYKGIAAACTAAIVWSPRGIREFLAFTSAHGPSVIDVLTELYGQTDGKSSCLYVLPPVLAQIPDLSSGGMTGTAADAADAAQSLRLGRQVYFAGVAALLVAEITAAVHLARKPRRVRNRGSFVAAAFHGWQDKLSRRLAEYRNYDQQS